MAVRTRGDCLLRALAVADENTAFVFHSVNTAFCPYGPFSTLNLQLTAHCFEKQQIALKFSNLFEVEATNPKFDVAKEFIRTCEDKLWPVSHPSNFMESEKVVVLDIVSEILVHLCSEVTLEKRYVTAILGSQTLCDDVKVKLSALGLGCRETWYGTPDLRVRGVVFCHSKEENSDRDDSGAEGDGMTTPFEGKIHFRSSNLPQLVGISVVASFTEKTNHPDKSALLPTILIDKMSYRICLYDSEKDVLLLSTPTSLSTNGHLSPSGIALLWVVMHHRLFIKELPEDLSKNYPAGIKKSLKTSGYLHHFCALKNKDVDWDIVDTQYHVKNSELPVKYLPLQKKRKLCDS